MTDLVLIHPGTAPTIYGGDLASDLVAVEPPVWTRIIAGYAQDRQFSVHVIDAEAEGITPYHLGARVAAINARLACVVAYGHQPSASTQQMDVAAQIAAEIKRHRCTPTMVVGGHVAALPAETLRDMPAFDYACSGEGPETVVGLLQDDDVRGIKGLVWRGPDSVRGNPPAKLLDMDDLHGDVWDKLPMGRYRAHNWQCFGDLSSRQPYASIHTSLGCPYKCSFCCINAPFGTNKYRMRDPWDVAVEVERLHHNYGVRTLKIVDEMFVLNEAHYTDICDLLAEMDLDLNIWAYARVDTVKAGKLALLRRAGIRWLALGIESASAYVRDGSNKRFKNDDIAEVVRAIQAAGINVIGNFIFGLPDDTMESMSATLDLAQDLNCEFANFYSAMAYPGSALWHQAVMDGRDPPTKWSRYSQHSFDCEPLGTDHVSPAAVLRFRDEAFHRYFTSPRYLDMVGEKFGQAAVDHVRNMASRRLKRRLLGHVEEAA